MLKKQEANDLYDTVSYCYKLDPSLQEFSRNSECDLKERVNREVEGLQGPMKLYKVYNEEKFVGYFGTEDEPFPFLCTFFILPEHRDHKDEIFNYMIQDMPQTFYAALFDVNVRAKKFYEKHGGNPIIAAWIEDKPSIIYEFKR